MFKITFDDGDAIEKFAEEVKGVDIDTQKAINWYINQVYRDLARQHGNRYTYVTPPANTRTVLRKRSGKLLEELSDSRFVERQGDQWTAGFNILDNSILAVHEGSFDDRPTVIKARTAKYMTIPLKAALSASGVPLRLSARQWTGLKRYKVGSVRSILASNGEDLAKLSNNSWILAKRSGRLLVPYYLLAKSVTIKKRIFIYDKMNKYYNDIYDRLNVELERAINKKFR